MLTCWNMALLLYTGGKSPIPTTSTLHFWAVVYLKVSGKEGNSFCEYKNDQRTLALFLEHWLRRPADQMVTRIFKKHIPWRTHAHPRSSDSIAAGGPLPAWTRACHSLAGAWRIRWPALP